MNHHATLVRLYPGIAPSGMPRFVAAIALNARGGSKREMKRVVRLIWLAFGSDGFHVVRSPGRIAVYDSLGRIAASITQSTFRA